MDGRVPTRVAHVPLERQRELASLAAAVDRAIAGQGGTVLVEGPMGIGKTALLRQVVASAEGRGGRVCCGSARGSRLEQHFAFGVVVQLLGRIVDDARSSRADAFDGAARLALPLFDDAIPPTEPDGLFPLLHGLHWLCATLAEDAPLVLVVDDAQWADEPSRRWLAYLAERAPELPLLLVVGRRTGEDQADATLDAVAQAPAVEVLRPRPLSVAAVGELLRSRAAGRIPPEQLDPVFTSTAAAIERRSAGNPLFARELVRAAVEAPGDDGEPLAAAPPSVVRLVAGRIDDLPPTVVEIARAVAVLGEQASVEEVAALADATAVAVLEATDRLTAAEILDPAWPMRFVHPLVQEAVLEGLPPGTRAQHHARAAAIVRDAHPVRAATHLVAGVAAGLAHPAEPWVVPTLMRAAAVARARGGTGEATRYLQRALEARPDPDAERDIRADLGTLLDGARDPEGVEHLAAAQALAHDPLQRARIALRHGDALFHLARLAECSEVCRAALADLDGGDAERDALRLTLEAAALNADALLGVRRDRPQALREHVAAADTPARRRVLVHVAADLAAAGTAPAHEVARIARAAVDDRSLVQDVGPASPLFVYAGTALSWAGDYDAARAFAQHGVELAQAQGSLVGVAYATSLRAGVAVYQGDLLQAEADARLVLDELAEADPMCFAVTLGWAIEVAIEREETAAIRALLDGSWLAGPLPDLGTIDLLLLARGALAHAEGDHRRALEDLEEVGRRAARSRYDCPAAMPWRSRAAACHLALGDTTTARRLADEELAGARAFGAPRAIGLALLARAAAVDPVAALADLREAEQVLARSGARLAHAQALVALGAVPDGELDLQERRTLLRRGMDLGHRCGSRRLVETALGALRATGARPRRPVVHGAGALTPQERRVARLAAAGDGNREIAQALFLTRRTVEMHLTNAYRKLGIDTREALADALAADGAPVR